MKINRPKLISDWNLVWKRWSVWLTSLMVSGQLIWAAVPGEARAILPRPEVIGIVLGILALLATIIKQGGKHADD